MIRKAIWRLVAVAILTLTLGAPAWGLGRGHHGGHHGRGGLHFGVGHGLHHRVFFPPFFGVSPHHDVFSPPFLGVSPHRHLLPGHLQRCTFEITTACGPGRWTRSPHGFWSWEPWHRALIDP